MESLLVKIFATALTLSQVATAPDAVKTRFDRVQDQPQVAELLRAGCAHMRKAFDIEDINLDELIATALDDPQAIGENKVFRGINFVDLQTAYKQFCKNELCVAVSGGEQRCSMQCVQGIADSCPPEFTCLENGDFGGGVCWPTSDLDTGCGCSSHGELPPTALFGLGVLALLFRRRSR